MPSHFPIKAFGIETQMPRWAISALALVLLTGIGWTVYQKVYADPEQQLISLKDANKQLAAEVNEYSIHVMEEPEKHELFEEQDGKLILRVYKDHCVLIQRQTLRGVRTKLVMDLARSSLIASQQIPAPTTWNVLPTLEASSQNNACQRGCLNPHPGPFKWWYGDRRGEWIEVWRRWDDQCTHVQLFHPQTGAWDSNADGTARVRWVCCTH